MNCIYKNFTHICNRILMRRKRYEHAGRTYLMADSTTVDEPVVTELSDANSTAFDAGRTESANLRDVAVTRAALESG